MQYESTKNQLIDVCHKLLDAKEARIKAAFCEIYGYVIGEDTRAEIISELFEDILNLKEGRPSKYHLYAGRDTTPNDYVRVYSGCAWFYLLSDKDSKKRELGNRIKNTFFEEGEFEHMKIMSKTKFKINEEDFAEVITSIMRLSLINQSAIREIFLDKLNDMLKGVDYSSYEYPKQFKKICDVFELTDLQKKILYFYYIYDSIDKFESFVEYTTFDFKRERGRARALAKLIGVPESKIQRELRRGSKLSQTMLLSIGDRCVDLTPHIYEFLFQEDESANVFSFFYEKVDTNEAIDVKHHRLKDHDLRAIKYLIKCDEGSNVLLYGESGTGKTEFTKSIGRELGINVYRIKNHDPNSNDVLNGKRSALMAANNVLPKDAVLVVDEAEEILGSGRNIFYRDKSDNKAWLNTFMEESKVNIIWITNDMTMHPSTKRRFDYAISFESFTRKQRHEALKNIQKKSNQMIFNDDELMEIANEYKLDPGALSLSFKKTAAINDGRVDKKSLVTTLLNSQMKLIKGTNVSEKGIENFYDPDFVNTSINESEIIESVKMFYEDSRGIRNLCILFQGIPGTGKTEYAKYISESLEKSMSVKRASDVLSKYWGETEKNIANMFMSAEKDGDILFLDECDSLFKPRGNAEYSWMVSETNELLTQMERFQGVLICATNFVENLDRAAMRRFHLKVRFDDLKSEAIPKVYNAFFKDLTDELNADEVKKLKSLKGLNPGDFKAVYNALVFKKEVKASEIISRLEEEVSYKNNSKNIGFNV